MLWKGKSKKNGRKEGRRKEGKEGERRGEKKKPGRFFALFDFFLEIQPGLLHQGLIFLKGRNLTGGEGEKRERKREERCDEKGRK